MKRMPLIGVAICILLMIVPAQKIFSQTGFKDVAHNYWARGEIEFIKEKGFIQGYEDGTFRPEGSVSRAESAAIIVRMLSLAESPLKGSAYFSDVPLTHWSKDNIRIAYQYHLVSGYEDGTFRPENQITRAETAALLAKTFQLKEGDLNEIIGGITTILAERDNPITRAEFSVCLARVLKKQIPYAIEPAAGKTYQLVPADWGIYNDGTHPLETTKGFNDALKWAQGQGITTFKVPAGTYTVQKGNPKNQYTPDPEASINLVGDMTFWLDDHAVIQKESNGYHGYNLLYIGPDAHSVTLKGGTYRGDKDTHDYSSKGTHENGVGIMTAGAINLTVDGIKAENFTGDGLAVGGYGKQIDVLYESDFESGAVTDDGQFMADPNKIRTKKSKTNFNDPIFQTQRTIHFSQPQNLSKNVPFSLYFYKSDGTFISSVKNQELDWSMIDVPVDAGYFVAVFDTSGYENIRLEYWVRYATKNAVVKNSEFAFNRRQGITVGGVDQLLIQNNNIHDIKGTAPQSGIDLEGGIGGNGDRNMNVIIKDNRIYNNAAYNIVLYDGQNALVEGNYLGPNDAKTSVGVAVSSTFRTGAIVKNNTFDGSKIAVGNEAGFIGNQMKDSVASFVGPLASIDGMTFTDSQLIINADQPYGVTASNIKMYNTDKSISGLTVNGQPVRLSNITISGESKLRSIAGNAVEGSSFEDLKILGYSKYGLDLPRGTYRNCVFEAAAGSPGEPVINQSGKYEFNACSFTNSGRGFVINHENADVAIKNSSFDAKGNGEVIYAQQAKKVQIENNAISAKHLVTAGKELIKISGNSAPVSEAVVRWNTIISNIAARGISTANAGAGTGPYTVENNVLINAKLELRDSDVNRNNTEK